MTKIFLILCILFTFSIVNAEPTPSSSQFIELSISVVNNDSNSELTQNNDKEFVKEETILEKKEKTSILKNIQLKENKIYPLYFFTLIGLILFFYGIKIYKKNYIPKN